jgi:hypothetical protein
MTGIFKNMKQRIHQPYGDRITYWGWCLFPIMFSIKGQGLNLAA